MRLRWLAVPAAACAVFGVVACGSSSDGGAGPTTSAAAAEPPFDPCAIPENALRGVGVDPTTREPDFFGVKEPGWRVCGWQADAGWYFVDVFATDHGIDQVRTNPENTDFAAVRIAQREAFTYREIDDTDREMCDVAFGNERESVLVRAAKKGSEDAQEDLCAVAVRSAQRLDAVLPTF